VTGVSAVMRSSDMDRPVMLPEDTVVPLTNLPTAHPSEESTPVTPVAPPASQDPADPAEGGSPPG
jgi:hypothetical protein